MDLNLITVEQALFAYQKIIAKTGGSHGLRDVGLLQSALARPAASFAGEYLYKTIFDKAAALLYSLLLNHAFADGNKRTATYFAYRFLEINGYVLKVSNKELAQFALDVESKKLDLRRTSSWLKKYSKRQI